MRKKIDVNEAPFGISLGNKLANRKIMNDIMYYLRRLLKLARVAQSNMLREGTDIELLNELDRIKEEVDRLESNIE